MLVFNALMKQPVSFSSWGQFDVGRFPVEVKACDYGIVKTVRGEEYLSVFFVGKERRVSLVCADSDLYELEGDAGRMLARRLQSDLLALEDMGVAVESIEWDSWNDTPGDRQRWRDANLRRW